MLHFYHWNSALHKRVRFLSCAAQQVDKDSVAGSCVSAPSKATAKSFPASCYICHRKGRLCVGASPQLARWLSPHGHMGPCAFLIICTETHSAFLSLCVFLHARVFFSVEHHPVDVSDVSQFEAHLLLHLFTVQKHK